MSSKSLQKIEQRLSMLYGNQQLHPVGTLLSASLAYSNNKNTRKEFKNVDHSPCFRLVMTKMIITKSKLLISLRCFAYRLFKDCNLKSTAL